MSRSRLHISQAKTFMQCGYRFKLRYVDGRYEPGRVPQVYGKTIHVTQQMGLDLKIKTGALPTLEAVQDFARDEFHRQWDAQELALDEDERQLGAAKVKGLKTDMAIKVASAHRLTHAPFLSPAPGGVEKPWSIDWAEAPIDLAGTMDLLEREDRVTEPDGEIQTVIRIRDLKTRARTPSANAAHTSLQLTMYALAHYRETDTMPDSVHLDMALPPSGKQGARVVVQSSTRTEQDFDALSSRLIVIGTCLERGIFQPTDQETDYLCAEKYCGFALDGSCKYFVKRPVSVGSNGNGGGTDDGR